jgi:alkylhydroperoxidase family enzyme
VAAHTGALRAIGVTDEELAAIEEDLEKTDFSLKEKALIGFACMANLKPLRIPDQAFAALRDTGVSDAEIVEALGVMGEEVAEAADGPADARL